MIYQTRPTHEPDSHSTPVPCSHQSKIHSSSTTAATTPASTPFITPASTPATSCGQFESDNAPNGLTTKPSVSTRDFHPDTFFNPIWMSGPHVFSFAKDGTVVRPETYAREPYPGYHADRARRLQSSAGATRFQGSSGRDTKPWKNVAITEQDDEEWEMLRQRARMGTVGSYPDVVRRPRP